MSTPKMIDSIDCQADGVSKTNIKFLKVDNIEELLIIYNYH
jgi:hypothetical protein